MSHGSDVPEPGTVRWNRAHYAIWSRRYDKVLAPDLRDIIDGRVPDVHLDDLFPLPPVCEHDWVDMSNVDRGGSIISGVMCAKCRALGPGDLLDTQGNHTSVESDDTVA